jgi:hypothetical protein
MNNHRNGELRNFYEVDSVREETKPYPNPNFNLTQISIPFHMLVVAKTGTGKTNAILNLIELFSKGKGTFSHLYILHKIEEPLYNLLRDKLKDQITFYKKITDLPDPKDLNLHEGMPLIIFDDVITIKDQKKIEEYYIYGRKLNNVGCCCIYISQKYYSIPIIIRAQARYILLLKIRETSDLKRILKSCDIGINIEDFIKIYEYATKEELSFLKIDAQSKDINKALSKNFNQFIEIE